MCEANLTDGGEGSSGWKPPEEWIQKCRERYKGEKNPMYGKESAMKGKKHSEEAKLKISQANKGRKNPPLTPEQKRKLSAFDRTGMGRGRKLTEEHKAKIKATLQLRYKDKINPLKGKKLTKQHKENIKSGSTKNKKVIDTNTGIIYNSIGKAAQALGYNRNSLKQYLSGRRTNKTSLIYFKEEKDCDVLEHSVNDSNQLLNQAIPKKDHTSEE